MTDIAHGGRLLAVLPRGEALRNFVYSGVLDQVAARAAVSVWSIVPNAELWAALGSRYPDVSELHAIPERTIVGRLRDFVDMTHGRWLWSGAARNRWLTRDGEASTPALRVKRLLKKAACYPFANRPGLSALSMAERQASWWLRLGDNAIGALRRMKPSLVFNASHVHGLSSAPLMRAAQSLGIPTATFIFSWDNLTSQGRLHTRYDHYLVWNEPIRDQLLWMYPYIRPEQVVVTGTPQFDFHFDPKYFWSREEFCARIGADPARPIVLYTTSMARPVAGEERIVEGIARFVRGMKDVGSPQLLVRVYPKDRTGRFDDIKRRYPDVLFPKVAWEPNWLTPMPDDTYMLTNTLRHAALGINVASTVSLELCMFRKPVINVAYNPPGIDIYPFDYRRFYDFDHYRPVTLSGAVRVVRSEDEMPDAIREALARPDSMRNEQQMLLHSMFGDTLDGKSADRVAKKLLEFAGVHVEAGIKHPTPAERANASGTASPWYVSDLKEAE